MGGCDALSAYTITGWSGPKVYALPVFPCYDRGLWQKPESQSLNTFRNDRCISKKPRQYRGVWGQGSRHSRMHDKRTYRALSSSPYAENWPSQYLLGKFVQMRMQPCVGDTHVPLYGAQ